jgi:hypothetical protein
MADEKRDQDSSPPRPASELMLAGNGSDSASGNRSRVEGHKLTGMDQKGERRRRANLAAPGVRLLPPLQARPCEAGRFTAPVSRCLNASISAKTTMITAGFRHCSQSPPTDSILRARTVRQ